MGNLKEGIQESYARAINWARSTDEPCCGSQTEPQITPSFGCVTFLAQRAGLKEGDIVVDFGSGPGHDVFDAAQLVGESGKVIGIDLTPDMIEHASNVSRERGITNVEFRLGDIERVPLPDNFADVVISNCVINLSLDKAAVFREAFRILKPGGILIDADEITEEDLPQGITEDVKHWCMCIGGAMTKEGYLNHIKSAGFVETDIQIYNTRTVEWRDKKLVIHSGIIKATKPQ